MHIMHAEGLTEPIEPQDRGQLDSMIPHQMDFKERLAYKIQARASKKSMTEKPHQVRLEDDSLISQQTGKDSRLIHQ